MEARRFFEITAAVAAITGAAFGVYKFSKYKKDELNKLLTEKNEAEAKISELYSENIKLSRANRGRELIEERLEKANEERDSIKGKLDTANEHINKLVNKRSELLTKNSELITENSDLWSQKNQLQGEVETLRAKTRDLSGKLEQDEFYGKEFSKRDYLQALLTIYTYQKANIQFLINEIKISYKSATALLKYLESRKLISTPVKGYAREILFDENFVKTEWAAYGASLDEILQKKDDEPSTEEASEISDENISLPTDDVHSPLGNEAHEVLYR